MQDLEKYIKAYALKNALEFGKAEPGKILPKLFQHGLDKKDISKVMPQISEIVKKVNSLNKEAQQKEFAPLENLIPEKEEKPHTLPELPNAQKGKVVTRLPPEPSKYLHLGHAMSFLFNYIYAKNYDGKCLLRFEDANPEKVTKEFVTEIQDDIDNYLELKYDSLKFISDDMPLFYQYADNLLEKDAVYMCFCDRETMQNLRHEGKPCPHRSQPKEKNKEEWKKFLDGKYLKGEAVLRLKGDMTSNNQVMRDPVLFRAMPQKHFRHGTKYKVWPLYDFYNPIEDSLMGITHILRTNEFDLRVELQDTIKDLLGLSKQTVVQYGRITVIDATTKGREIREQIASGEFIGWDDPRLMTLKALKRRGIQREALIELANQMGLSKKQVNLDFDMIAAISRKILDKKANRFYFIPTPKEIKITNPPKIKSVNAKIHPEKDKTRKLPVTPNILISEKDFEANKGKEVRLMNLFNIQLNSDGTATFTDDKLKPNQKIQWVSKETAIPAKVLMPDCKWEEGFAESESKKIKTDEVVQFERFGFCRLDKKVSSKNPTAEFWFTHK